MKIKSAQLRKGNIMQNPNLDIFKQGYVTMEARWIYEMSVYESAQTCAKYASKFNPILITVKWLLRMGFVPHGKGSSNHYLRLTKHFQIRASAYYVKKGKITYQYFSIFLPYNYPMPNIDYVHQLQNLYHSLKQKEIKIKKLK